MHSQALPIYDFYVPVLWMDCVSAATSLVENIRITSGLYSLRVLLKVVHISFRSQLASFAHAVRSFMHSYKQQFISVISQLSYLSIGLITITTNSLKKGNT